MAEKTGILAVEVSRARRPSGGMQLTSGRKIHQCERDLNQKPCVLASELNSETADSS